MAADLGGNCCEDLEERLEAFDRAVASHDLFYINGGTRSARIDPTSFALDGQALRSIGASIVTILSAAPNDTTSATGPSLWVTGLGGYGTFNKSYQTQQPLPTSLSEAA